MDTGPWPSTKSFVVGAWTLVGVCLSSHSALTRKFLRFWSWVTFPEKRPAIVHNLFLTVILGVVSGDQDRQICALGMSARCWVKKLVPVHSSGFIGCIPEEVYGVPSIQEV